MPSIGRFQASLDIGSVYRISCGGPEASRQIGSGIETLVTGFRVLGGKDLCDQSKTGEAEAAYKVIVYQAHRLHEGVADGGSDEVEAASLEIFALGIGIWGSGGDLLHRSWASSVRGLPSTNCQMCSDRSCRIPFAPSEMPSRSRWRRRF